ncbi:hypothetical protein GLYMA_20G012500v4 [Glycine max]|uniref:Putative ascorbate-specific transmembrane electron transporter 1 isoform B n=1 Tax=Glycine soja TaxID=3848 RepID=A0A445EZF5_GLYSO|nr:probable ascorbate-specific transmembrane electron transporter 1 isoform X2 [Glycine soja]KAG4394351.1 hypothetical protein GLYMA_20G012500v4 [Glycine max]KAH1034038.1 hypothetical protein GYH30_054441 [Glycine max]RZB41929.1 putative ascorbate-specific transmembrane electron transporter 1 isoform B [Glycine soja]
MARGFQVRATSVTIFAHLLFIAIATLVLVWLLHFREGVAFFSSSNPVKIFNLHPLLMVIGFILVGGEAIMIYKSVPEKRRSVKVVHLLLHLIALVAGIIGIIAVFKSKKEAGLADMYTLHSWLGMSAISLFGLQKCLLELPFCHGTGLWAWPYSSLQLPQLRRVWLNISSFYSFSALKRH